MDLRQTKPILVTVLATALVPLVFGWYAYWENPQGILLYTPMAGHSHPQGSPAFTIGVMVGLAASFLLSLLFVGLGGIAAYIASSVNSKARAKLFCKIAVTSLATSTIGAAVYAMLP